MHHFIGVQLSLQDKFLEIKLLSQKTQMLIILVSIPKLPSMEAISLKALGHTHKETRKMYTGKTEMLLRNTHTKRLE